MFHWLESNWTTILNLTSFCGIAILAIPTLSLNKRKNRLHQAEELLDRASHRSPDEPFNEIISEVQKVRETLASRWRPIDQNCLFIGYFLLLGSSFFRVFS